ncbi:Hsp70 family protein [Flindersiella endophytica]
MSDQPVSYFGIDLGTTYSAIAFVDDTGRPTVVRSPLTNEETTPSVVFFENEHNVVVGRTAKDVAKLYPDRVVSLVKREMGRERQWEFHGATYTPESISALILKQLVQDAEAYAGREVKQVVITVPAYFGMLERDATRKAGEIAGLDVIGIVPEPVAAALQYEVADQEGRTILVYDLGGGTFDTTVIRVTSDAIEVLCTDGDQKLGGADWDERLISYLLDSFVAQASPDSDPRDDEQFMQELAITAEDTKRQLSQVESRPVAIRFAGAAALVEVSRETFNERTRDLLDRTIEYTRRTLEKLQDKEPGATIDDVLLVGGATRMPAVSQRLKEEFGWEPRLHDPDLAVAKGAARYALGRAVWHWQGESGGDESQEPTQAQIDERIDALSKQIGITKAVLGNIAQKKITGVLPKAFGVRLVDTDQPNWEADQLAASYVQHLVHADEQLPSGPHELEARTVVQNQTEIEIAIYEQAGSTESPDLADNKAVDHGNGIISGLPPLPVRSPLSITMNVDHEGLLSVHAVEPTSGKDLTIEVRVSVLSQEEVDQARANVSAISVRS